MAQQDTVMTDNNGRKLEIHGADKLLRDLDKIVPQTRQDRSKIVEAGVPVAAGQLSNNTPKRVHRYPSQNKFGSKTRNPLHIKEAVTHQPDEYADGSTDVGFTRQAAPIARWVDQGTYRQDPQFFIEHAFQEMNSSELFGRETQKAIQMLKDKNPDFDIYS